MDVVNVASVAHRSPFRYPGGKTWFVPLARKWLQSLAKKPVELTEPFAGGAIVGLSCLFDGLVSKLSLVELDQDIAAVWHVIVNGQGMALARRIVKFQLNADSARHVLSQPSANRLERAFAAIVRNRVQRGGIMAPGASLMKQGENGNGIASRWYARTLHDRIVAIAERRQAITFLQGDGIEFLRRSSGKNRAVHFIDPPYTVAGRRLYQHSELNHEELFEVAAGLEGDFLMTYDDAGPIRELAARLGFATRTVPMKNTHHAVKHELVIGRNLDWLDH
jgi:DNA adenine methylase